MLNCPHQRFLVKIHVVFNFEVFKYEAFRAGTLLRELVQLIQIEWRMHLTPRIKATVMHLRVLIPKHLLGEVKSGIIFSLVGSLPII